MSYKVFVGHQGAFLLTYKSDYLEVTDYFNYDYGDCPYDPKFTSGYVFNVGVGCCFMEKCH